MDSFLLLSYQGRNEMLAALTSLTIHRANYGPLNNWNRRLVGMGMEKVMAYRLSTVLVLNIEVFQIKFS